MADAPRLLALASATSTLGVALLEGGVLRAELLERGVRAHGERVLPAVARLLAACGWELAQLDAFALATGPGVFTGLRVGLATVKALAFDGAAPVLPVSTLAALAAGARATTGARKKKCVAALLDARRGEVYAGAFGTRVLAEGVYGREELVERLPRGAVLATGEGAGTVAEWVCARRQDLSWGREEVVVRGSVVGRLGWGEFLAGRGVEEGSVVPVYLRGVSVG